MITIVWYNAVAIVAGLLVIFLIRGNRRSDDDGAFVVFGKALNTVMILMLAALFYALWGGIFWW